MHRVKGKDNHGNVSEQKRNIRKKHRIKRYIMEMH